MSFDKHHVGSYEMHPEQGYTSGAFEDYWNQVGGRPDDPQAECAYCGDVDADCACAECEQSDDKFCTKCCAIHAKSGAA